MQAPFSHGVRFAPSPTGRFHIGNLRTAWISFEWSRHMHLPWVVRFEDIDQPRVLAGARNQQLADMSELGLKPDIILTQTDFRLRHWSLFVDAIRSGQVYACDCSRKEVHAALAGLASAPHDGVSPVYSGRCRELDGVRAPLKRSLKAAESLAWRFRMPDPSGRDDFIVARSGVALDSAGLPSSESSFVPAYHWACAIDDFDGGYELLVRSIDLAPAAVLQRAIFSWLCSREGARPVPALFHTSLVVQDDGHRLEKRTKGVTLPELAFRAKEVLHLFERSFNAGLWTAAIAPEAIVREERETIRLSELLSTPQKF